MDKREKIINSANSLFLKEGYVKTSIDKIAKLSGISKGSVYTYFNSKEEILSESIYDISIEISSLINSKVIITDTIKTTAIQIIEVISNYLKENPQKYEILSNKMYLIQIVKNPDYSSPFKMLDQQIFDKLVSFNIPKGFNKYLRISIIETIGDFYINGLEMSDAEYKEITKYLFSGNTILKENISVRWNIIFNFLKYLFALITISGIVVLILNVYLFSTGRV
jgi:AcrR family transcriptional regulator